MPNIFQILTRRPVQAILTTLMFIFLIGFLSRSHAGVENTFSRASRFKNVGDELNQTLGFEQILVVSLPERTDRRDSMILASALSNIKIEFIDAVHGPDVLDKALPPNDGRGGEANLGSWRGHMNAISEVVRRNLTTAFILEDDADWDIRIKEQLSDFASSTRALIQPLKYEEGKYADSTYPIPDSTFALAEPLSFHSLPQTKPPKQTVYGDNWDILWIGHCGMRFPIDGMPGSDKISKGRVVRENDNTVPENQNFYTVSSHDDLRAEYGNHTRVVSHVADGICSLGYAVTQAGARRLLHALGLSPMTGPFDIMLKQFCDGVAGKGNHNCLTVHPGLFQHHRPAGNLAFESDISDHGTGTREKAESDNLRWGVKMNFKALLEGETLEDGRRDINRPSKFIDQFPDTIVDKTLDGV